MAGLSELGALLAPAMQSFNIFEVIESVGIIGAIFLGLKQSHRLQEEIHNRRRETTVDRMYQIRTLLIQEPDLHKIWDGGLEGEAIEGSDHRQFYLVKMLLHLNESLFLGMEEAENSKTRDYQKRVFEPWRENLKTDLSAPAFREIWVKNRIVRDSYDPSFQDVVNRIILEIEQGDIKPNKQALEHRKSMLEKILPFRRAA